MIWIILLMCKDGFIRGFPMKSPPFYILFYLFYFISILLIIMKLGQSDFLMKTLCHATPAFILSMFTDQKCMYMPSVNFWRH